MLHGMTDEGSAFGRITTAAILWDSVEPASLPAFPARIDAPATALWITAALAGEIAIPQPILNQLACCIDATRARQP